MSEPNSSSSPEAFFEEDHVDNLRLRVAARGLLFGREIECRDMYVVKGTLVGRVEITNFTKRSAI